MAPKLVNPDHSECHAGIFHVSRDGALRSCTRYAGHASRTRPAGRMGFVGSVSSFVRWIESLSR